MEVFIPIVFLGGVFTLIAMKIRYRHLDDIRASGGEQLEVEHLADTVESLRAEVERLNERVEFTERLLERPKTDE